MLPLAEALIEETLVSTGAGAAEGSTEEGGISAAPVAAPSLRVSAATAKEPPKPN